MLHGLPCFCLYLSLQSIIDLHNELGETSAALAEEEEKLRSSWQDLENDEQQIDQLREEVERMEQDKARLNQEQDQCQDKLERGRKLLGKVPNLSLTDIQR